MGTIVFWIMICLLLAVLIISTAVHEKNRKAARRKKIMESFGDAGDVISDDSAFDKVPALLGYMKESDPASQCLDDITVFDLGLRDLYKRLNRCMTSAGEAVMYCLLRILCADPLIPGSRYKDTERYISDKEKALELLYVLDAYGKSKEDDEFELIKGLRDAKPGSIWSDIVCFLLLVTSIISIAFYPVIGFTATVLMIIICIFGYFTGKRHMDANLKALAVSLKLIRCGKDLCESGCDDFELHKPLFSLLKGNCLISYRDGTSSDPLSIIFDYIRMITHIDLIAYNIKIAELKDRSDELAKLYIDVGMLDAKLAVASFLYARKHCCAKFSDKPVILAKQMYHPLLKEPVCNDIDAQRGILLTGSNASGKSTFLKAIGINEICARSFGFAFAGSFETGEFLLYTSMALSDDLLAGESYYVVEARSIKRICDAAEKGSCLCIIDEILRGTNTIERIAASTEVLRFLCRKSVLCFAATHDKELTGLLADDMDMYYFTEEISGENVTFPFAIQKGISEKTNAIKILSMLGFDSSIVTSADGLANGYKNSGRWGS